MRSYYEVQAIQREREAIRQRDIREAEEDRRSRQGDTMNKCNAIGPRGGRCRRNAQVVGGLSLDFCQPHNQMVQDGIKLYCSRCETSSHKRVGMYATYQDGLRRYRGHSDLKGGAHFSNYTASQTVN